MRARRDDRIRPASQLALQVREGFPVPGTAKRSYDASDLRRAIEAYKFFYGTVATEAVMQQGLAAGAQVNEVGTVMATSPRQQFGGANADTPYAITTVDLKAAGPMVVELPPGPFIGFVDDHNMRWVLDMGTAYVYALGLDRAGQRARALALLSKAQQRFTGDRDILGALVELSLQAGDREAAVRWAQKLQALGSGAGERR